MKKVRIYPKMRCWDGKELQYVVPSVLSKKKISTIQNKLNELIKEYEQNDDQSINTLIYELQNELGKFIKPDRDKWNEIKWNKFLEYWNKYFGYTIIEGQLKIRDGYLEGELEEWYWNKNYMYIVDHQIYNEEKGEWESGNKTDN